MTDPTDPTVSNEALTLDAIPAPDAPWPAVRTFARAFDAPDYHGTIGNVLDAAEATRQRWQKPGLERAGLCQLRSALFVCALEMQEPADGFPRAIVEQIRCKVAAGAGLAASEEESFLESYDLGARFPDRVALDAYRATAERAGAWFVIETDPKAKAGWEAALKVRLRPVSVRRFASSDLRDAYLRARHRPAAPATDQPSAPVDGRWTLEELEAMLEPEKVTVLGPKGHRIATVDEWKEHAPPKSPDQWRDGRSAKELARAWAGNPMPDEVERLLKTHAATAGFVPEVAFAEHCTALDGYGEPRNHDLVLVGHSGGARVVVGIEAKADESFGTLTVGAYRNREVTKNLKREKDGKRLSRVPDRIDLLCRAIFGTTLDDAGDRRSTIAALRYQLLTALAGTAIEARERSADRAVLLVHEFVSAKHTTAAKLDANRRHLRAFAAALPGVYESVMPPNGAASWLLGPIRLPGAGAVPSDVPVLIGKALTDLRLP